MRDYSFGNFLRELRERRGLSQYQLGMLVGVSNKAVSKWENGSAKPQNRILYKLGDILGVTVDELLSCTFRSPKNGSEKGVFAMKNQLWKDARQALRSRYGSILPVEIQNRYLSEYTELQDTELIVYFHLISQLKTIAHSLHEQVLLKGALGASFVAYVLGATEINPLRPHYFCPHCHKVEFDETVLSGWDLPAKRCSCGREYRRDGHNLPFETLRFFIRKTLHFELSVSPGAYRAVKKAIGAYFDENTVLTLTHRDQPNFETIVIAKEDFPDLMNEAVLPFEEYYDRLKTYTHITLMADETLDSFRLLEKETGTSLEDVDFTCPTVLEAFQKGNTDDIPDFRSDFIKDMLKEVSPSSYNDLIQVLGLSHGSGVWSDDVRALIRDGKAVSEIISYRDDVFRHIQEKMKDKRISNTGYACKIMEDTRRGIYARNGVPAEIKQQLASLGLEDWFTESIGNIQYLFPKAFSVLHVKYALILMWYKLNQPEAFRKLVVTPITAQP